MLDLFLAVAFSAVPLTLYVPPVRSLNLFVETLEGGIRQSLSYGIQAYLRIHIVFSRIFRSFFNRG